MEPKTLKTLEFHKILSEIAKFASSTRAREEISQIAPYKDLGTIRSKLNEVEEASLVLFTHAVNLTFGYDDVTNALDKASIMSVLTLQELLRVARVLKVARNLKNNILRVPDDRVDLLKDIALGIFIDTTLEDDIDKAILSENEVSDNASLALKNIRQKIKKIAEKIKIKLNSYITSPTYQKYMQDNIVTIRNDRYVIPVKSECRSAIGGLIHDQSASGQTIYIEPMIIVELNNDLKTLLIEENQEIERILREFTYRISINISLIKTSFDRITELDIICAKAFYAEAINAKKPIINDSGYINIVKGKHPLIDKSKVIANSVKLGDKYKLLFVTGPNTGGKTIILKLVGILEAMALSGIFVPCLEAELSLFDNIYCDIGDEQSIEQSLSTFSSHIANIVKILDNVTPNTLILLDELGAGTDPTEGASLAIAISEYIVETRALAIITTHYNELKEFAVVNSAVENASMDFDPTTYSPTYRLIIGTPGASNALLIAEKLGLNTNIVARAKEGIKDNKVEFNNVLDALEKARKQAEIQLDASYNLKIEAEERLKQVNTERDRLFRQRELLNENVKKETKRLVEEAMQDANDIIEEIKTLINNPTDENLFRARNLKSSLKKYIVNESNEFKNFLEEEEGSFKVGDRVFIISLQSEGIIESFNKKEARVKIGAITSNIKIDGLKRLKKIAATEIPPKSKNIYTIASFKPEINLIGQTSDECIYNLSAYIDQSILSKVNEIRIIHGIGAGILRETVRNLLKTHPAIASFRDGKYGEGERGVTIAILK